MSIETLPKTETGDTIGPAPEELTPADEALLLINDTKKWLEDNEDKWCRRFAYTKTLFGGEKRCAAGVLTWKAGGIFNGEEDGLYQIKRRLDSEPLDIAIRALNQSAKQLYSSGIVTVNDERGYQAVLKVFRHAESHF